MKTLLVRLAFAGAFVIGSSAASAIPLDHPAGKQLAQRAVAIADKSFTTRIVEADYQLSDQERTLLAFLRLKANAERDAR